MPDYLDKNREEISMVISRRKFDTLLEKAQVKPLRGKNDVEFNQVSHPVPILQSVEIDSRDAEPQEKRAEAAAVLRREEAVAARVARDETAAREWRLHFWARDGVKQLHSALQLAEVLREREVQGGLNGALEARAREEVEEQRRRDQEAASKSLQEERERRQREQQAKEDLRRALDDQVRSNNRDRKIEEEAELVREKQEMQKLREELRDEEEKRQILLREKRSSLMCELDRVAGAERSRREEQQQRELREVQLAQLYTEHRHHVQHALEARRKQSVRECVDRHEIQAAKALLAAEEKKLQELNWVQKLRAERAQKDRAASAARVHEERERRRRAVEVQKHQAQAASEQRAEQQRKSHSVDREARRQHDLVTRTFKEHQKQALREMQTSNAAAYAKQREEHRLAVMAERASEVATASRQQEVWALEDRQFLTYAERVLEEARLLGRPDPPLRRALQLYKSKFRIEHKPTVKPSMRSHLDIGIKKLSVQNL